MGAPVEIRYAGVALGEAMSLDDGDESRLFLRFQAPLPVGTMLELARPGWCAQGRVVGVVEEGEGRHPGMRLAIVGAASPAARPQGEVVQPSAPAVDLRTNDAAPTEAAADDDSGASEAPPTSSAPTSRGRYKKSRKRSR